MPIGIPSVPEARHYNHRTNTNHITKQKTMSYTTTFYHIVFRTYRSEMSIPEEHERELYAYIFGIARKLNCQTYRIGGMSDHVHMFVSLPATLPLASFVQQVKTASSKWMKANPHFPAFHGWGHEYAGFSYSIHDKGKIVGYILRQKEHHKQVSFAEEYHALVKAHGIVVDDRYFLRDE